MNRTVGPTTGAGPRPGTIYKPGESELERAPEHGVLPERTVAHWFLGRMLYKFAVKREKETGRGGTAGWEAKWAEYLEGRSSADYLIKRALEEFGELMVAMRHHDEMPTPENRYAVIDEAADVANFMALLAYKFRSYPYHPEYSAAEDVSR